jgi:putative redox protein
MTKTTTVWKEKQQFKSYLDHNEIELDGDKQKGFGPKALLLSALAACSGIDIVDILEKMRVSFSDLEIDVEADQTSEHPRVFKDIHITYKVKTDPSNKEKVKKAISLSLEKYCGVSAMLKKSSAIHCHLELA